MIGTAAAQQLRVGVASADITPSTSNPAWHGDPQRPIYIAGFGENRTATGVHDPIWARAVVFDEAGQRIAFVSVDLIGYYWDQGTYGTRYALRSIAASKRPKLLLVASTHDHEAPDTIGLWGPRSGADGKDPEYLKFVDTQIARAVIDATDALVPATISGATIDATRMPELHRLQQRTRPPAFMDDELRVIQISRAATHRQRSAPAHNRASSPVIATLVNWNTHPESMESHNHLITSDFPDALRREIEKRYGGMCIYFSGDIGAVEAPGDADVPGTADEIIHGQRFPRDPATHAAIPSFARTQAIGAAVADAASHALDAAQPLRAAPIEIRSREIHARITNTGYLALIKTGVLRPRMISSQGPEIVTTLYDIRMGDVEFVTLPGELFPELYYGVAQHKRSDCPAADNGRPPEPAIHPLLKGKVVFALGLCPDELGYILPDYDFRPLPPQPMIIGQEAVDACPTTPTHYHETNSIGYEMGPAVTCGYVALLGGNPDQYPACTQTF